MSENERHSYIPPAEQEFSELGIEHIRLEGPRGETVEYPVEEFCSLLPTAKRLARSYGFLRVASLIGRQITQLKYERGRQPYEFSRGLRGLYTGVIRYGSFIDGLLYCFGDEAPYNQQLPYSIAQVLCAQLTYRVREKFRLPQKVENRLKNPPPGVTVHRPNTNIPLRLSRFLYMNHKRTYRDPSLTEKSIEKVLQSGIITLVGANLPYQLFTPWESNFILRYRTVYTDVDKTERRYTIPGGHTMTPDALSEQPDMLLWGLNKGRSNQGHTLVDVTGLRELLEETGLPPHMLATTRPLTRADQIMRDRRGEIVRYIGYIWNTIIWEDYEDQLRDADGEGDWVITGPFGDFDYIRSEIAKKLPLTPIAEIALRIYRE